ncbi:ABC transporter substrate-binding protein [Marinivivus vitaminiproducens]|uniref:ABC transporter substrate-binding protein n=1 Tax=Marinivivus vitaminiproducens TaxID=3035935 RepID=UPI0027AB6F11|nr:spermidine/putrescine ABC transporter substrate-binding protein [Geminicoccaceae bacterium SCSIO 64248]
MSTLPPMSTGALASRRVSRRRFVGGSLAIAVAMPAVGRPAFAAGSLNVYNWDTYIGQDTVANFSDETGTNVRYDLYAGNDELFAKLREGNPGYDVIFPSNDYLERMVVADMVQKLDHSKIPNMSNLAPRFLEAKFDPGREHSLSYFWGTQGVGYRTTAVDGVESWSLLFDSEELSGRKSLLTDVAVLQTAMKYLGFSANSTDPAEIQQAIDLLIRAKPTIQSFAPDTGQDLLISGEVDLAMEYSGDIMQVMEEDDELSYAVPQEGAILWEDVMAIPTGAPNVENAHAFINYILTPEVHAEIAEEVQYACPNQAAVELLPEDQRNNPVIYPSEEVLDRCEFKIYMGEETEGLYAQGMTRVLAS